MSILDGPKKLASGLADKAGDVISDGFNSLTTLGKEQAQKAIHGMGDMVTNAVMGGSDKDGDGQIDADGFGKKIGQFMHGHPLEVIGAAAGIYFAMSKLPGGIALKMTWAILGATVGSAVGKMAKELFVSTFNNAASGDTQEPAAPNQKVELNFPVQQGMLPAPAPGN